MSDYQNLSIKQWALEDRPREKFMAKGLQSLSDAELIAILIGSGSRDESAVELSKKILSTVDHNLHELGKLTISELKKQKGIGEAKAITIIAALELGRRRKVADIIHKDKITSSMDAVLIFQSLLGDLPHEEFWVLFLNRSNKIIDKQRISQGGLVGTVIDVKIIMKMAIEKLASSIILCHNHPSGNAQPSESDISITKKLKQAGEFLEIAVLDHLIIADDSFYSFADEGFV
ncbi:MAG: DNA repair protein RadC [Bacteroidales bacterium]|nr:DNA repair protein RadC [Bacteroidales bacterium]MCF8456981.1 DNA repair protein RadC [Bacteroidales bacterium]